MNKFLFFLLISLSLPMISPAQNTNITAKEANKKGDEYYDKKNYTEAIKWYRIAAEQGDAEGQNNLGVMYENGNGVAKDYTEAAKWYRKAAEQGDYIGQYNLGVLYENGYGVTQDYAEAVKWYRKAAEQGDAPAQNNLGGMYNRGYGVTKDCAEAVKWYKKAAEQGHAPAQYNLGNHYRKGYGVSQDYSEALKWYKKAAEQGYAGGQVNLGFMYEMGYGVTQDYEEALKWYRKAADQGNASSMNSIGYFYEKGNSVPQNYQTAKEWYQKALNKDPNYTLAKDNLAIIEKKIADQSGSNNNYAQTPTITQPIAKPQPKEETKPKVEPKAKVEPQPKVETFLVDTDIPVISRVNRNTFAIIIANEDYMDEAKVDFAKNDGEVFKNYCHKTLGLPETNIHYLPNATLAKMFGELDWLRQVCEVYKGEANVIFYYSGHGFPDEKSHAAYIIPVDGNKRLLRTCFSVSELYEMLGSMPSKRVTVLMDACFSGAKRSGDMLASAKGVAIKVKYGAPKGNMVVMAAAQGDETAYFNKEAKHGLFTYYLLKKLKETKGSVTLGDLSSYIQDEVSKYSIVVNGKSQTPTVQASDNLKGRWESMMFE